MSRAVNIVVIYIPRHGEGTLVANIEKAPFGNWPLTGPFHLKGLPVSRFFGSPVFYLIPETGHVIGV